MSPARESLISTREPDITRLIDLQRYPVHELASDRGQKFLHQCRRELDHTNACNVPGFLDAAAARELVAESEPWCAVAYEKDVTRNPYTSKEDLSLPSEHPNRRFARYKARQLAYDQVPPDALIDRLYRWSGLINFVAAVLGHDELFLMADPFQALNVVWMRAGENSSPHFDHHDYTITLLLEAPRRGGESEFVPDLRSSDDECYDHVTRVLDGDCSRVRLLERGAGTLTLFRGRDSLHWVTPVEQGRRTTAILCYDQRPDFVDADAVNLMIYGDRIKPLLGRAPPR